MKIALTGKPGVGKTTIIKKVVNRFKDRVTGFFTEEIRDKNGKREGFKVVTTDGRQTILAEKGAVSPFSVGSYGVFIENFEKLALPILQEALKNRIIVIDEIGKMGLFSDRFEKIVREIFSDKDTTVLATLPYKNIHPLVSWIKRNPDVLLFTVTEKNRDILPDKITEILEKHFER
ncbi:NTPase [Persephonella sp.]